MVVIGREDGAYTAVTDDGSASGDSIIRKAIRRTAVAEGVFRRSGGSGRWW